MDTQRKIRVEVLRYTLYVRTSSVYFRILKQNLPRRSTFKEYDGRGFAVGSNTLPELTHRKVWLRGFDKHNDNIERIADFNSNYAAEKYAVHVKYALDNMNLQHYLEYKQRVKHT